MKALLSQIFPILYGACFLVLLWQAFKVMGQGFRAASDTPDTAPEPSSGDRTGRLTIHPELLDAEGQLTEEDLLTVRFGGDQERSAPPGEPG
ncbi:MAG: DUF2973 domain-containing protein [Cyanobium sp. PLM2.Bin73]|nr:MAG: DUF2973 domain-containing protein [Cyanobium sp. PLM2.Bin73]